MNTPPSLIIRADAGGQHGSGHVMRMIALAQAYQRLGGEVIFLCGSCPVGLVERVRSEGFRYTAVPGDEVGDAADWVETLRIAKEEGSSWLVLDGYHFQPDYHLAAREAGMRVLCADDFGHCGRWSCDAYLNQNLGAEEKSEPVAEVTGMPLLRGTRFTLLRREFVEAEPSSQRWGPVRKVLITMGGVDPDNATLAVLRLLDQIGEGRLEIRALLGAGNPHVAEVKAFGSRHDLDCVPATSDMVGQYRWADAVISAGGSSCWEWLYLGLPGAVVTIADNQLEIVENLRSRGLAQALGWPDDFSAPGVLDRLRAWLSDPAEVVDEKAARSLIDGKGAERVARFLAHEMVLRVAEEGDAALYFDWVNDPAVRANALVRKEIPWDEHVGWFSRKLDSADALLLVAERRGEPVGQVRFERGEGDLWEVGISVTGPARGGGIGGALLWIGLDEFRFRMGTEPEILARVRVENEASRALFQRAGFSLSSTSDDGVESYLLPSGAGGQAI